jgi:hypothetical protein
VDYKEGKAVCPSSGIFKKCLYRLDALIRMFRISCPRIYCIILEPEASLSCSQNPAIHPCSRDRLTAVWSITCLCLLSEIWNWRKRKIKKKQSRYWPGVAQKEVNRFYPQEIHLVLISVRG